MSASIKSEIEVLFWYVAKEGSVTSFIVSVLLLYLLAIATLIHRFFFLWPVFNIRHPQGYRSTLLIPFIVRISVSLETLSPASSFPGFCVIFTMFSVAGTPGLPLFVLCDPVNGHFIICSAFLLLIVPAVPGISDKPDKTSN